MGKQAKLKAARRMVRDALKKVEKSHVVKVEQTTTEFPGQTPPDLGVFVSDSAKANDVFGRR